MKFNEIFKMSIIINYNYAICKVILIILELENLIILYQGLSVCRNSRMDMAAPVKIFNVQCKYKVVKINIFLFFTACFSNIN